jgi:cytoskeletal protein CcmA (bactofilin family)
MSELTRPSNQQDPPRWFTLAMASRWPLAVVISAWAIAVATIQVLKQPLPVGLHRNQPLPVRLVGGITLDQVRAPVRVQGEEPLKIEASATLPVRADVEVPGGVAVSKPVAVTGAVNVSGNVNVDEVTAPVTVHGPDQGPILVGSPEDQPLSVDGNVDVKQVGGKIKVQLRNAAQSVLPIP